MFLTPRNFDFQPSLLHFPSDGLVDLVNFDIGLIANLLEAPCYRLIRLGFQLFKREQLHLAHIFIHANSLSERRIDIHSFFGDTTALFRAFDEVQRPHIMQTVSKLDQKHADIIGNREQKLAQIFCRTLVLGLGFNFRQLSDAINQARHFRAKAAFDVFDRGQRIFHRVMQQRRDYRVLIHFEVSHQASNLYGMAEIGIT